MIISWLVIAGLFLLVIFQYREVTRYRHRFNRLLGERLGLHHRESVSFIDQVELVDDVGRTRRLAINVTSSATLERHHAAREVQARVQNLERQALFDHLTGLYSRGKTEEAMRQAIAHAQRYKTPLALAMFDIDLKPCTPPRKPGATGWWRTPAQVTGRLRLDVRLPAP
tara:strand:- start:145 stop:651 length:507 start_codon:yes stop_codon:yes gene_type:complete